MAKLILRIWSNSYGVTKEDLIKTGNKILSVRKAGDSGHTITYRHNTLTSKPKKGDLVIYYRHGGWTDPITLVKGKWARGLVQGTEDTSDIIEDHVSIDCTIIPIGDIKKVVDKIPKRFVRYLR